MTIAEFFDIVAQAGRLNPRWRFGQALFNVLCDLRRDLAEEIRGTELDPFYDDDRAKDFLEWLQTKLEEE